MRGLYLCGAGTHPGGGVTGANGRNCAREVVRDARTPASAAAERAAMSPLIPSEWASIEAPVMRTEPPGPRSREILARIGRRAYPGLAEGLAPFALASKRAWTVTDADGNVYLDLASASASVPLGAGREELIAPAVEALRRFGNEDSHALASELTAELGERLLAIAPPERRAASTSRSTAPRRSRSRSRSCAGRPGGRW